MLTVHLSDLQFYAYHGIYEGEAVVGGNYQVDLRVGYDEKNSRFDAVENIISYEELFSIVKKRMAIASPLLEEVADAIIRKIKHRYSVATEITLSIYKLQPPIEGFQGKAGITLQKKYP
ncbi:MAG: dihydroneopterin aldolase [Williamsia sp.]|nr:dihydroneopterin aldolase [Williamsia sp.]